MRLRVTHTTIYQFSRPVVHGLQRLRLTPKNTHGQQVIDWTMALEGVLREVEYDDHHHNRVTLVSVIPGSTQVTVESSGTISTADNAGVTGQHTGSMPLWAFMEQSPRTRPGPKMRGLIQRLDAPRHDTLAQLHQLSALIRDTIAYVPGETGVHTTAEEAAAMCRGVCQDHAHVFIGAARALGVPARYVSGYLMMNDRIDQEASHAWAEAHIDHLGWVGFDVSNGISPDERYIRVATGRDYSEAAPVTGLSWGAGETRLAVQLAVEQQRVEQ